MGYKTYKKKQNGIEIYVEDFDIKQTLECGQCFRFFCEDNNNYFIIAHGRKLNISQKENKKFFLYPCTVQEFEDIWLNYFDLQTDYSRIKKTLAQKNKVLAKAINLYGGIRILNQEKWETLISFIISQNNRISQIKKVIENISQMFGTQIDNNYFAFPSHDQLLGATEEDLNNCRAGFRSKYILDAIKNTPDLKKLDNISTDSAKKILKKIKGVGDKVSDCVLLFAYNRHEVYPVDTWVKRVSQEIFFDKQEVNLTQIREFAQEKFGDLAGYAQQYLFYYIRNQKNNF